MSRESTLSDFLEVLGVVDGFTSGLLIDAGHLLVAVVSVAPYLVADRWVLASDPLVDDLVLGLKGLFDQLVSSVDRGGRAPVMSSAREFNAGLRSAIKQLEAAL